MWLLMIMLSVGPYTGQYKGENDVWLHIQMRSQSECIMAADDIMTTARIFQHLNPNLKVDAICRRDIPVQTNEDANYIQCINYSQCLDMFNRK